MTPIGPRRVLVTGAAGFIGSRVVSRLIAEGDTVIGIGQGKSEAHRDVSADLSKAPPLSSIEADCLIHLAALSGGIQAQGNEPVYHGNVEMARSALELGRRAGVDNVVLASSSVVYQDPRTEEALSERHPTLDPGVDDVSPYAWSKLTTEVLGQWFASKTSIPVVSGRLATVYGPGGSFDPAVSNVVHALIDRSASAPRRSSVSVWGTGDPVRSFIYVEDAAAAIILLSRLQNPAPVYNVASSEPTSIRRLAELIVEISDRDQSLEFDSSKPDGPAFRYLDTTLIQKEAFAPGWSLRDGLKATIHSRLSSAAAN